MPAARLYIPEPDARGRTCLPLKERARTCQAHSHGHGQKLWALSAWDWDIPMGVKGGRTWLVHGIPMGRSSWSASEDAVKGHEEFWGPLRAWDQGLSPLSPIWILECPIMVIMLSKQTQRHRTGLSQPLSVHVPSSCAPCQKSVQACLWACQAGSHERSGTVVHGRRQNTMSETSWSTSALVYLRTRRFPAFWMCLHTAHRMHRPLLSWLLTALSSQTCKTIVSILALFPMCWNYSRISIFTGIWFILQSKRYFFRVWYFLKWQSISLWIFKNLTYYHHFIYFLYIYKNADFFFSLVELLLSILFLCIYFL